jgi:hypothetical protein
MAKRTSEAKAAANFAADRSHKASEIAYDLCKVTAQACLLINGGAATAVIAYLSKDNIDRVLFHIIPWCLLGYGLGVLFSAAMMFCEMMNADYWNYHWYYSSYELDAAEANRSSTIADRWHFSFYCAFILVVICFLAASGILSWALLSVVTPIVPPGAG